MSTSYSISIILNLEHTKKNIEHIFQQCIENNMYLYADPFDKLSELDSANAAVRILTFELEDDERNIFVRFQDTDFFMWIYNKNNLINLSMVFLAYYGKKNLWTVPIVLILRDISDYYLEFAKILLSFR